MPGVSLREGATASSLLYDVLEAARGAHADVFEGLRWPESAKVFRADYASTLIAFERRRLASPRRAEIAQTIVRASAEAMVYEDAREAHPLDEYLSGRGEPLATETCQLSGRPGLVPELTFRGEHRQGAGVAALADEWLERAWMTEAAHRGVRWSLDAATASGRAELVGHKIVSLGGGAELSPTRAMLRAGADVLFIDAREPGAELFEDPRLSGSLSYVPGGANLLTQPREVLSTIERFADGDPVHIGMYAYSGGAAQEWRLTAAMNAIVRALPAALVRSVVMLISPTTPGTVSANDAQIARSRGRRIATRALSVGRGPLASGQSGTRPNRVSHSIVGLQGAAYQAAQYVGKMMAAESYAVFGVGETPADGLTISAPVAPITRTASLAHPLFDAGFEGAGLFGILISEPQATRVMCALLAFHDLLCPDAPSRVTWPTPAERVAAIAGEQIHGGVYAQPYSLEREIIAAAFAGFARRPGLVPPALRFMLGGR